MNSGPTQLPAEEIDPEEQQQLHDPRVRTHPLHARLLAIPGPHSNIIHTPDKETFCSSLKKYISGSEDSTHESKLSISILI